MSEVDTSATIPPTTAKSSSMAPRMVNFTGKMSDKAIPMARADLSGIMELWQPESAIMGMDIDVNADVLFIGCPSTR